MDIIQFLQENNECVDNENLIKQKIEMNKHDVSVISDSNRNKPSLINNNTKNNLNLNAKPNYSDFNNKESLFASNSFTDYSSIDCESLTDSSNNWTQNNENDNNINSKRINIRNKNTSYNNDDYIYKSESKINNITENNEVDIQENFLGNDNNKENYEKILIRPKKSRLKPPLLAEILNNHTDESSGGKSEEPNLIQYDRPRTRRGKEQDSQNRYENDYIQLNNCVSTNSKNYHDVEINEELEVNLKSNQTLPTAIINSNKYESKVVEILTFEENTIIDNELIYTPPLPIDEQTSIIMEEIDSNKNHVEYITYDKILTSNKTNNSNNSLGLPKIKNTSRNNNIDKVVKNPKLAQNKPEKNYQNSPYSKYHEFQSGRVTNLSNFKDYKLLQNREKYNISRNTNKSTDSKTTFNTFNSSLSLHSRKMNQEEILKSVNRLSYVPKRNFEHQKFATLHDKFSNVDINAVSLRLFSSKSHRIKQTQDNSSSKVKCLNKIEIDKMVSQK